MSRCNQVDFGTLQIMQLTSIRTCFLFRSKPMMKHLLFIFLLLTAYNGFSQNSISCQDFKLGVFYMYPKNDTGSFIIYRTGDIQKEVNLVTGDSAIWKIKWIDDCAYQLKFISTSGKLTAEQRELQSKHDLVISITGGGKDYYTFQGSFDNSKNPVVMYDTMWLSEKMHPSNSPLFQVLKSERDIHRMRDTSKYAILYLYRPHKLTNAIGSYLVYFDNVLMSAMPNNSGYIFKILKEGSFPVTSRLLKEESTAKVDIRFGHVYYVKAAIKWTISKKLYNFRLETTQVANETGEIDFEKIKNK